MKRVSLFTKSTSPILILFYSESRDKNSTANEYIALLEENDSLKKNIVELEIENENCIQTSKGNSERIKELLASITELQSKSPETSVKSPERGKPFHLDEMEWTSTWIPTEEGWFTKRSTQVTEWAVGGHKNILQMHKLCSCENKNNLISAAKAQSNRYESVPSDTSFQKWAKELDLDESSLSSGKWAIGETRTTIKF